MFMQFTRCKQPVQRFYRPGNAIDWLRDQSANNMRNAIRVEQDENHADEILDFMPVGAIFYNYTRVNVSQCKWEQLIFLGPFA